MSITYSLKARLEIDTHYWALFFKPRKFHVFCGHLSLTPTLKGGIDVGPQSTGEKNWDSGRLIWPRSGSKQRAGMWARLFWQGDCDLNLYTLPPALQGEQIINIHYLYVFGNILYYERIFLKTQLRNNLAVLLGYQKIGFDRHRLSLVKHGIRSEAFSPLACFAFICLVMIQRQTADPEDCAPLEGKRWRRKLITVPSRVLLVTSLNFSNPWVFCLEQSIPKYLHG